MKYYLLFLMFILINNHLTDRCYDDDIPEEFNKEDCFGRNFSYEESRDYLFGEKPDSCCFVKRTCSIDKKMADYLNKIGYYKNILGGQTHRCSAYPKSKIKKIFKYEKLILEILGCKNIKVSIDCLAFISKINKFILIILIIVI